MRSSRLQTIPRATSSSTSMASVLLTHENINRARLKIDARKWLMSKLHPQRYGDRVAADVTVRRDMRELSDSELLQIVGSSGEPRPWPRSRGRGDGALSGSPDQTKAAAQELLSRRQARASSERYIAYCELGFTPALHHRLIL